jgi:ABC-type branched-subunit amino acid transport system substrate-binding protein
MTAQVTRVRGEKPDAIFDMSSNPPPGAIVAKKIYQLGMKQPIIAGVNLQTQAFAELAGDAASQILYIGYKASVSGASGNDPLAKNLAAFRTEFEKIDPGVEVVGLSVTCADSILLTQVAAKSLGAKALDHEALLHALETLNNVPGIQGYWTFSPTSHESLLKSGIAMLTYDHGKWLAAK